MLLMKNCPAEFTLLGERRCFSSRLVTQSYATKHLAELRDRYVRRMQSPTPFARSSCTSSGGTTPVTTPPVGMGAIDLQNSYGLIATGMPSGSGKIVAIVDACADTSIVSDMAQYRTQYNLPALPQCGGANGVAPTASGPPCIGVVSQTGSAGLPPQDDNWAGEIALDVEMVSAACPDCSILLVEANSASNADLDAAVNEAVKLGANAVSNSYGSSESGNDSKTAYTHPGVLIAAASGDNDYYNEIQVSQPNPSDPSTWSVSYNPQAANTPASMDVVLSVGGTTAVNDSSSPTGFSDQVWSHKVTSTKYPNLTGMTLYGGGSGCSQEFAVPSWQTALVSGGKTGSCQMRASVDLSAAADYNAPKGADGGSTGGGLLVYQGSGGGWVQVVGTSASTPFVTAMLTRIGYANQAIDAIYAKASTFHDVTTGNDDPSNTCTDVNCNAGPGWDGPTGLGTPNAAAILGLMSSGSSSGSSSGGSSSGSSSGSTSSSSSGSSSSGGSSGSSSSGSGSGSSSGSSGSSSGGEIADAGLDGSADGSTGNGAAGGGNGGSSGCSCNQVGANSTLPVAPMALAALGLAGLLGARSRRRRK
jgi:MYXO-CTERM domain-containing protein